MSLIDEFERFYSHVSLESIEKLDDLYCKDAVLVDPITQHQGLNHIKQYFRHLLENTHKCDCTIQHISQQNDTVFLTWKMTIGHPTLNNNEDFDVNGISHLKIEADKIVFHRDYYDLGEMVYERVPVLKHVVKLIKKRMG